MKLQVRGVEGRQILDPRTAGSIQQRRIGYLRVVEQPTFEGGRLVTGRMVMGKPSQRVRFTFDPDHAPVELDDTRDGLVRRAILAGDLEYVATVEAKGKTSIDATLKAASEKHAAARAAAEVAVVDAAETPHETDVVAEKQAAHRGLPTRQIFPDAG